MYKAFLLSIGEWLRFGVRLIRALPYAGARAFVPRLFIFLLVWLLSGLLNLIHWIGFAIDECLFRSYRNVEVKQPLFIVGIPRSGTTWLQRVMAQDEQATSLTLWECIFAPSITQRFIIKGFAKLVSPIIKISGFLFQRVFRLSQFSWFNNFNKIHKLGLSDPEEDFLLLLPVHACFLLVLLCPEEKQYWRLARFDDEFSQRYRNTVIEFYQRCVQKHLYFHGPSRRFLSKNPSFTPFLNSLREHFPDAHFVACIREPEATIPSQISSLIPAANALGIKNFSHNFVANIINLLKHYYEKIEDNAQHADMTLVENSELHQNLKAIIDALYQKLGIVMTPAFAARLDELSQRGKNFRSQHQYNTFEHQASFSEELEQFSLQSSSTSE